jgi:hypothetical protein
MARSNTTLVPTAGLEVAPFGILSPATTSYNESDGFWTSGFTYEASDAGVVVRNGSIFGKTLPASSVTVIDNTDSKEHYKTYLPFDIQASIKVSTMGTNPADIEATAKNALDIVTQKAIEAEFWDGGIAKTLTSDNNNRWLASTQSVDVTPTPGTGVKVQYGLALLEQAIADSSIGFQGVIHTPRDVASALRLEADGKTLRTSLGTPVVAGVGYSKKGPTGAVAAAGKAWMYATGPVSVRLGPTTVTPSKLNQAVNIRINEIEYYADRPAAVTWATTDSYAVLIDLTLDYA